MCTRGELQSRSTRHASHEADPTPERPSKATKNAHVAPLLMVPSSFGF